MPRGNPKNVNRDQAAKERLLAEKGVPPVPGGPITVTQNDLLAQIGALTVEKTVLEGRLAQAMDYIVQLQEQIQELQPKTVEPTPIRPGVDQEPSEDPSAG